jgi:hypothetical protein
MAMAKLIYASNMSLDGCTEDERGAFDWGPPDEDVFASITDLMRSAGTYLYRRRMSTANTRLERHFDPGAASSRSSTSAGSATASCTPATASCRGAGRRLLEPKA